MDTLELQAMIEGLHTDLKEANCAIARKDDEITELKHTFQAQHETLCAELQKAQERYDMLLANHHTLSKLNHELEEKLLDAVEIKNSETNLLLEKLEQMDARLSDAEQKLATVSAERDRLKEDCSVAVSLLQNNPGQFVAHSPKQKLTPIRERSVNGDPVHSAPHSRFPTFLPTFPPVGLPSMLHTHVSNSHSTAPTHNADSSSRTHEHSSYSGSTITSINGTLRPTFNETLVTEP